ncbi:MAG TPA: GNAT family N-acetyltransferase [Ktedonobacterales bacterium]|nr:GNAT family N-acetyltransferase [Ktedonobacterales bacterium]
MITSPRIDIATAADIAGLAALRIEQEMWESGERLLRSLLAWNGARMFIIRAGALDLPLAEGTTSATPIAVVGAVAAGATGVIGNVVVRSDYRRRGLARMLMRAALDWQRETGVRTVWLDATIDGRTLYRSLGFSDCEPSYYAKVSADTLKIEWLRATAGSLRAYLAPPEAIARAAALDTTAFGGDRMPLLLGVLREPETWLYLVEDAVGNVLGYLMARSLEAPLRGIRAGSWVAQSDSAAAALLAALAAKDAPWRTIVGQREDATQPQSQPPMIHISPPGNNPAALALLKNAGVDIILDDLIMRLDFPDAGTIYPARQQVSWLYAWLAAMVF